MGTMIMDCCLWTSAWLASVLPMKMPTLHRLSIAPDDHHLRPFST